MDYLHGPKRQRRFRHVGLETILGRERLTMSFARSGFFVRVLAGNAYQNPRHYITQFAESGRQRIG